MKKGRPFFKMGINELKARFEKITSERGSYDELIKELYHRKTPWAEKLKTEVLSKISERKEMPTNAEKAYAFSKACATTNSATKTAPAPKIVKEVIKVIKENEEKKEESTGLNINELRLELGLNKINRRKDVGFTLQKHKGSKKVSVLIHDTTTGKYKYLCRAKSEAEGVKIGTRAVALLRTGMPPTPERPPARLGGTPLPRLDTPTTTREVGRRLHAGYKHLSIEHMVNGALAITLNNETKTILEWSDIAGVNRSSFRALTTSSIG